MQKFPLGRGKYSPCISTNERTIILSDLGEIGDLRINEELIIEIKDIRAILADQEALIYRADILVQKDEIGDTKKELINLERWDKQLRPKIGKA